MTSERSMNGIISIYSEDIAVNKIDANEIDVDDLTINNSLEVNNITLSPETISFLDGATSNIQTQIDNISNVQADYVDLSSNQTITGQKTFTNTTTLTGNLNVNSTDITPLELSYLEGATSNIQDQINNSVVGMTLDTDQTATGFKIFENGINTPFIQNSDQSGFVNGFLKNLTTILFSSYNGVWDNGVSIVSGGNVTNKLLVDLDPNITPYNEATIATNDELQAIKTTQKGYIPSTDTFLLKDVTNVQVLNGIVFGTTEDIIDTLVNNQITLQYNTGISQTPISIVGTIIQIATDYYLITNDSINVFDFIECANTTPLTETILNPASNQYLLSYTGTAPTESTNVTINNFNYNNKLFTDSIATDYTGKYAIDNLNIPYGSKLTSSSDNSVYTFSLNPSNQISIDDVYGFYDNGLYIFETTNITNPSTKSLLLQNTEEHGFITSISANNEIVLSYDNFQTTLSATNHSYVKNLTGTPFMIIETNRTDSYSNNSSISLIGSNLGGFSYGITSPNTIVADTPNTISVNYYLPDSTTILFQTSTPFVVGDFYEIGSNYGYRISSVQLINGVSGYRYGTSSNSSAVNTTRNLVGVVVENYTSGSLDGTYSFLYSNFLPAPIINSPLFNVTYAPQNSICFISTNTRTNQTKSFGFTQTFNTVVPSPKRENKSFRYIVDAQGNYIFDVDTKTIQLNDIVQYIGTGSGTNDSNNQRTGYHINNIKTVGVNNTALYQYGGLYSESASSSYKLLTGTSDNLVYVGFNTNTPYFRVATSKFSGSGPAVGDFIYFDLFDDGNYSYTYITSVSIQMNTYFMYVNFDYNANLYGRTAYFYKPESQNVGIVTIPKLYNIFGRITYDEYTFNTTIDKYDQTNKFYIPETYNLFVNTTTKIYDEIAINEFPAIDFNIYQNYQYNFQTTKNISLPSVGQNDTFVTRRFQQTLTNKKIGDDLIVDGRITLTGENDPSTLLCKISPFGFGGGNITAENNLSCSNILDCSNNAVEHKIGDISIGDVTPYGVNNPALAHKDFVGTSGFNMILQNTGKLILNAPTGQDISLRNNNTEYFYVDEFHTRLRQASGSVVETFCDSTNCYMDFQTAGTNDYDVRFQIKKSSNTVGSGYLNVQGNLRLQNGYLAINFRDGTSLPNGVVRNVEWSSNTLPTGFTKNDIGGGYSTTLTNNSGYDRTLVMGGNLSINTGSSGFLLIWLGQGSTRLFTFQAPIENGSISVTISFTFHIANGNTVFFQAYQNSGGTRTIANNGVRRSRVYGQVL